MCLGSVLNARRLVRYAVVIISDTYSHYKQD